MIRAEAELRYLRGVGPRRAQALAEQGIRTVEDLLYVLPFRYEDRRRFALIGDLAIDGAEATLSIEVRATGSSETARRRLKVFEAQVGDASGTILAVWYNQPYLEAKLVPGRRAVLYGRATVPRYYGRPVLENPEIEWLDDEDGEGIHTGRIVPVYRKLADLSSRMMRRIVYQALGELDRGSLVDIVPAEVRRRHAILDRPEALQHVHFPAQDAVLGDLLERSDPAHRSLVFEEVFLLQLALMLRRHGLKERQRGISYQVSDALRTRLAGLLPFKLTQAQKRVLREIGADLRSEHPMYRLLQGDVGSGKTIVALLTLLVAVENGYQGVLMAPTEILAEQHFRSLSRLLQGGGIECPAVLLTGALRAAERRRVRQAIAGGEAALVVGTHALFEEGVEFRRLGLVVIDEQHRFGVMQRAALAGKAASPDVLVMTATPIPRSLALTLYGDLDVSTIDELPPGRSPVRTVVRGEEERENVYGWLREAARRDRQAYVVVPLVEETEKSDLKAATAFAERLREGPLRGVAVGMLHGRMRGEEKERVMADFAAGRLRVLVATTVIEVGIDVPQASVMVVEHAERFGLSQLHQLRGRVGRGAARSYCVLMVGDEVRSDEARQRLEVMSRTTDGFRIAEKDLELRGPGMIFGTQQHGLSDLQFLADVLRTPRLLDIARDEARLMVADSGGRQAARGLLDRLGGRWQQRLLLARVG